MSQKIKLNYSFSDKAVLLDEKSEELKKYEIFFEKKLLPEIKKIEKRKIEALEHAYRIRVS